MSEQIPVQIQTAESYRIMVGKGILDQVAGFLASNYKGKVFVVIDQNVADLHGSLIKEKLDNVFAEVLTYIVPAGEKSKSLEQFSAITDFILKERVERKTPLVAIGGGVVGDLAGFAAASVLRGIPLIHIPTTLLAMVDSSIGGKTGVNHTTGKNLIGAFYQPQAVFADVNFLETLPDNEWVNGLSEIIKYGMISDPEILETLKKLTSSGEFASPEEWIGVIRQSASIKADIVNRDVKESGLREFLNFGHTFAHVIERKGNYTEFSHGEAVFAGMFGAIYASNKTGASVSVSNLKEFQPLYSIKLDNSNHQISELVNLMLRDKKVKNNTIRLVLLEGPGNPVVRSFEETEIIEESWEYIFSEFN